MKAVGRELPGGLAILAILAVRFNHGSRSAIHATTTGHPQTPDPAGADAPRADAHASDDWLPSPDLLRALARLAVSITDAQDRRDEAAAADAPQEGTADA